MEGDQTYILTETIEPVGEVARMFFIPDCYEEKRAELISMIILNGGVSVSFHESCTYQILPNTENESDSDL
jgi:hypothetical protein